MPAQKSARRQRRRRAPLAPLLTLANPTRPLLDAVEHAASFDDLREILREIIIRTDTPCHACDGACPAMCPQHGQAETGG